MAPASAPDKASPAMPRQWLFGAAAFDEAGWTLTVAGERVALENKPIRLLRELLLRPGQVVSKEALLDAVWPGVTVVEGSLATAMNKLRRALHDSDGHIIETVPGLGYRLAVPIQLQGSAEGPSRDTERLAGIPRRPVWKSLPHRAQAAAAVAVLAVGTLAFVSLRAPPPEPVSRLETLVAMRALDLVAMRSLIERGWDPRQPSDRERNSSINTLLEVCEWNRNHDRQKLMLGVRMLLDAGVSHLGRNVWGDTAYSIAAAKRYCGPDHPATVMLKALCTGSRTEIDPRCLADYAHSEWQQVTPPTGSSKSRN